MFLADATFEVAEKPVPTRDGVALRMTLVGLENVREVSPAAVPASQFGTYDEIVRTLTHALPDLVQLTLHVPGANRQYHTLRFESREDLDELAALIQR